MQTAHFLKPILSIAFGLLFLCSNGQTKESTTEISSYFQDRISHSCSENELVPFQFKRELKPGEIKRAQDRIWQLWRSVNEALEKLPAPAEISIEKQPLHHWDLPDEDPMPFYFIKKDNDEKVKTYPLFINLHGSGPKTMEFETTLELSKRYRDTPSIYFIPQIPSEKRNRWWLQPKQFAWEKLFRLAMLDENIDPNKIYMMGISEGGYGSQRLSAFYADYLAGAGPMAGGEPLENAPPLNYRNIAFSFHTGENDGGFGRNSYTEMARSAFDSLSKIYPGEFVHTIQLQKDRGHFIDYFLTTPWLVNYRRNPNPNHISWVNFPMNGRYRKSFYNIAVEEHPGMKEEDELDRAFFDIQFDKSKNVVTIGAFLTDKEINRVVGFKKGRISVFLNESYIDFSRKVTVVYNGKMIFNSMVNLNEANIVESCALFGDPERIFPAKISLKL